MRWQRGGSNPDVIDQRGGGGGGGLGGMPLRVGGGGGIAVFLVYLAIQLIGGGGGGSSFGVSPGFDDAVRAPDGRPIPADQDPERDLKDFSSYVFTNAQQTWENIFSKEGREYEHAKLVLYRSGVSTGCGNASSAVGPFYCPADQRVYLDLSFYRDMEQELGAPGDFAWAYVIAHEMGHHVQKELGTSDKVRELQQQHPGDTNELSVRLELQADCYSGVWAKTVFAAGDIEPGDFDEAFRASEAVGDDRLQRKARGSIDPDSFTHGSSAQRKKWFKRGQESGEPAACDTFSPDTP
jgi:predicted metalloprotease